MCLTWSPAHRAIYCHRRQTSSTVHSTHSPSKMRHPTNSRQSTSCTASGISITISISRTTVLRTVFPRTMKTKRGRIMYGPSPMRRRAFQIYRWTWTNSIHFAIRKLQPNWRHRKNQKRSIWREQSRRHSSKAKIHQTKGCCHRHWSQPPPIIRDFRNLTFQPFRAIRAISVRWIMMKQTCQALQAQARQLFWNCQLVDFALVTLVCDLCWFVGNREKINLQEYNSPNRIRRWILFRRHGGMAVDGAGCACTGKVISAGIAIAVHDARSIRIYWWMKRRMW